MKWSRIWLWPVLVVAVIAGVFALTKALAGPETKQITASFPATVSLYEGSDVRVLGVKVGTVKKVTPAGTSVTVGLEYDASVPIPANAKAVIVAPSVVGDRFVQLTPAYTEGPRLADGATLSLDQTATPVELDEVYSSIDDLLVAIGPDGANKEGALSDLLDQAAANLDGQGKAFRGTVSDFAALAQTLDANSDELFGSMEQLGGAVGTLAANDQIVRDFSTALGSVSELLAGERQELASAMKHLATALGEVHTFVEENDEALTSDLSSLNRLAGTIVKRRDELAQTLDYAPLALSNLFRAYNPEAGTLDTSANLDKLLPFTLGNLPLTLCSALNNIDTSGLLCNALGGAGRSGEIGTNADRSGTAVPAKPRIQRDPTLGGLTR